MGAGIHRQQQHRPRVAKGFLVPRLGQIQWELPRMRSPIEADILKIRCKKTLLECMEECVSGTLPLQLLAQSRFSDFIKKVHGCHLRGLPAPKEKEQQKRQDNQTPCIVVGSP